MKASPPTDLPVPSEGAARPSGCTPEPEGTSARMKSGPRSWTGMAVLPRNGTRSGASRPSPVMRTMVPLCPRSGSRPRTIGVGVRSPDDTLPSIRASTTPAADAPPPVASGRSNSIRLPSAEIEDAPLAVVSCWPAGERLMRAVAVSGSSENVGVLPAVPWPCTSVANTSSTPLVSPKTRFDAPEV